MNISSEIISPIFWEQGLFLQPQHFQLQQRFFQQINTKNLQLLQPYFFGFDNYTINEMQLNNGIFEISKFNALFADGTWVNFPGNAVLVARRFDETWINPEDDLPVYIGISLEKTISNNNKDNNVYQTDLSDLNNLQQLLPKNFRYVADYNPQKFSDLLTDETTADVRTLKYNVHLYFGKEIENINVVNKEIFAEVNKNNKNAVININNATNNSSNSNNINYVNYVNNENFANTNDKINIEKSIENNANSATNVANNNVINSANNFANSQNVILLPIAILKRDGERIILNKHFVPPMLSLQNSDALRMLVITIRDTLLSRAKQLEEYKIVGNDINITQNANINGGSGGVTLYIILFSLLGVISRHVPILNGFINTKNIHPWTIYLELCSLVGELSVFSSDLSPLGENESGQNVLPKYNHNNLYPCFAAATQIITRLVDSLVIGPEYSFVLSLQNDGKYQGLRIAYLSHEALSPRYNYWLLIRSQLINNNADNINNINNTNNINNINNINNENNNNNNNKNNNNLNLLNHIKRTAKLAPLSSLNGILARALPGIRLIHSATPPVGVPRRKNTLYFQIEYNDSLWQEVLKNGEVAFALPGQIDDLFVQIMVIEK